MAIKFTRRRFIQSILLLFGAILTDAFWLENRYFKTKITTINPEGTVSILQISDLHLRTFSRKEKALLKNINAMSVDLIAITGDAIDSTTAYNFLDSFLSGLPKDIPTFAILGNWEYWGRVDIQRLKSLYNKHNIRLLVNDKEEIEIKGKRFSITGLDDMLGGKPNYNLVGSLPTSSTHSIVLSHCPQSFDQISKNGIKHLVLSGHTHGGQLNLLGWTPFLPPGTGPYIAGLYHQHNATLFVSKGLGTSILPMRLGARSEINKIIL